MTTVLVADDDVGIRETIRDALEDEGYTVHEAGDGIEALAMVRASSMPVVALLDIVMQHAGGHDVLRAVGADQSLVRRHSYLLMTASPHAVSLDEDVAYLLAAPVIAKPFDLDTLLAAVGAAAAGLAGSCG